NWRFSGTASLAMVCVAAGQHLLGTRSCDRGYAAASGRNAQCRAGPARYRRDVFGTIKDWIGRDRFLTRKPANVAIEMSLHVLACNLKRAVAVLGTSALTAAM